MDVLTPIKVLSVSMQKDEHDPVFMLQRVQEFNWTMSKLQILVENSIDKTTRKLTNYTTLLAEITEDENRDAFYQEIKLKEFNSSKQFVERSFVDIITKICHSVDGRFGDLKCSPIYNYLVPILISAWPKDEKSLMDYGDDAINELGEF